MAQIRITQTDDNLAHHGIWNRLTIGKSSGVIKENLWRRGRRTNAYKKIETELGEINLEVQILVARIALIGRHSAGIGIQTCLAKGKRPHAGCIFRANMRQIF